MRIKFKILHPQMKDQYVDYDTIINYDVSSPAIRAKSLYDTFKSGNYFYKASGSGYNFDELFLEAGFDVNNYYQVAAYNVTSLTATIIAKEARRWSHAVHCLFPQGTLKEYFKDKDRKHAMSIYEWVPKSGKGKGILVFGPPEVEQNLNLMNAKTVYSEYLELPNESALDYFTGESIFFTKKSEIEENLGSYLGDSMSPELRSQINNFKEGYHFGMWCIGSVEGRFPGNPEEFPWAKKVSEIQSKLKSIVERTDLCEFIKFQKTKELILSI